MNNNLLFLESINIIDFSDYSSTIDFFFTISVMFFLSLIVCLTLKRKLVTIYDSVFFVILVASLVFKLELIPFLTIALLLSGNLVFCLVNSGYLRKYAAKHLINEKINKKFEKKTQADLNTFIDNMVTTVEWLSKNKVGALITIERKNSLNDFIKSGTPLNATFTPELVESIFYEGTRLHDGALIVQDTRIIAAAVYYPPSNNTFVGKFGARHRAAIGISEITDSITIIVSEETGRVAIAHLGVMDNIPIREFRNIFINQLQNN